MGNAEHQEFYDTIVEIDETYVGGKPRKGNKRKDDDNDSDGTPPTNKRGNATDGKAVNGYFESRIKAGKQQYNNNRRVQKL
jgi:hypothetical protein